MRCFSQKTPGYIFVSDSNPSPVGSRRSWIVPKEDVGTQYYGIRYRKIRHRYQHVLRDTTTDIGINEDKSVLHTKV